ncbi:MAG: hypothetical protein ACK4IX_08735, partial [Candidatus Sericytochromatia bacterium]
MSETQHIKYEDNKLFVDGKESTIEEAESSLKKEVLDFEKSIKNFLLSNLELKKADIEKLSDTVIKTRMDLANNQINIFDFGEYFRTRNIINDGLDLANKIISNLSGKRKKISIKKEDTSLNIKWKKNIYNLPNYEPNLDEVLEELTNRVVGDIIYLEFIKQFHSDLKVNKEKISVKGDLEDEFTIEIQLDNIDIYFKVNKNNGLFDDINELYIASGFKIGLLTLQDSSDDYLKYGNNFRTAQTIENVIAKEIRFLKTYIRSEIKYLEESIFNSSKKLTLAMLFKEYFSPFMDKKQKKKLETIISNAEKILNDSQNKKLQKDDDIEIDEKNDVNNNFETNNFDWNEIELIVRNNLNEFFKESSDKFSFDTEKIKDKRIFKLQLSGQKVEISIDNKEKVIVSSINSIGVGKNDIKNLEILGDNINSKIYKASLNSYKPLLIRQTENILSNIKGKKSKIIAKEIEISIKNLINEISDYKIDINKSTDYISDVIFDILDNIIYFDYKSSELIIILIDKLLKIIYSQSFSHFSFLKLNNITFDLSGQLVKLHND